MEYYDIHAEISLHRNRIDRCKYLIGEYSFTKPEEKLVSGVEISDNYFRMTPAERVATLEMMLKNSTKRVAQLERQHERLLKVSANFK